VLEDDPSFNAGRGAVFTYQGTNELDAALMDGRSRNAGAVTGVTATKNPVSLARAVMEHSPHVFLSREGADQFSREQGLEQVGPEWFATEERRLQLEAMRAEGDHYFDEELKYGTIGAVAVDRDGHVAAATSTGGLTGKRWGRIGDTPLIGSGTYADDRAGAVSATGAGEYFIRAAVAHEICARMRMLGESASVAADKVIAEVGSLGGSGGVILVTPQGDAAWAFNTPGMYRGLASSEGTRVAIYGDE
jgi:beta-aspartyl-peptidase (threonine type)